MSYGNASERCGCFVWNIDRDGDFFHAHPADRGSPVSEAGGASVLPAVHRRALVRNRVDLELDVSRYLSRSQAVETDLQALADSQLL